MLMPPRTIHAAIALAAMVAIAGYTPALEAQVDSATAIDVGDVAPDFSAPGATRYGLLSEPVKLSDYRGKTVVLAFFFKARTKG